MSLVHFCPTCSKVYDPLISRCPSCEGLLNLLRPCSLCGVYDSGSRHVIAQMAFVDISSLDSEYRHIECCAATGCPSCTESLSQQGVLTNVQ